MKIAELFYSVQGEGILVGMPSIFVRTSGCNLRCVWCDTPYTSWQPEGSEMSVEEITQAVTSFPASHVVLTGGEPMIAPQLPELTHALKARGFHITIETAGTVFAPVVCDLMSISPKLSNSTPLERDNGRWAAQHDRLRIQPAVLQRLLANYAYQLKFVVSSSSDLEEIESLCKTLGVSTARVVLMPEGTDAQTLRTRSLWLVETCKKKNFRFSPRLHVDLWGNQRGI